MNNEKIQMLELGQLMLLFGEVDELITTLNFLSQWEESDIYDDIDSETCDYCGVSVTEVLSGLVSAKIVISQRLLNAGLLKSE
jgi:hypothetical protein